MGFGAFALFAIALCVMVQDRLGASNWAIIVFTVGGVVGVAALGSMAIALLVVARFATDRRVVQGERPPGALEMAPLFAVFLAIVAWLAWLGLSL